MGNTGEALRAHWWRVALVAAGLAMGWFAGEPALVGAFPLMVWCALARSRHTGIVVGLVLLALQAWFVVPRALGASGPWVPSRDEMYWLYLMIAAAVCGAGTVLERRRLAGVPTLLMMVGVGLAATAIGVLDSEPGDEGVPAAAAGLAVAEGDGYCGSGNCARELTATGERAPEVIRRQLAAGGFSSRPPLNKDERLCRKTGVVVVHEVCAELRDTSPTAVRVLWYIN